MELRVAGQKGQKIVSTHLHALRGKEIKCIFEVLFLGKKLSLYLIKFNLSTGKLISQNSVFFLWFLREVQ